MNDKIPIIALVAVVAVAGIAYGLCVQDGEEDPFGLAGTPSDYSDPDNWLSLPEEATHAADTFYLYPTTYIDYSEGAPDIADIGDEGMRAGAELKLYEQASAFGQSTNVYAPFYRQTNLAAAEGMSQSEFYLFQHGVQRTDVYAALDHYFENLNGGRPFILAGHSQGSAMLRIVLEEYMAHHPEYLERMVAAYVIGFSVTEGYLESNPHLSFAEGETDTRVIVSWNTEGPGNSGEANFVVEDGAISINPLNWSRDGGHVSAEENDYYSRLPTETEGEYVYESHFADAMLNVERGTVVCTTADGHYVTGTDMFGPESLHGLDYGLYYESLRINAAKRVAAFLSGGAS